MNYIIYSKKYDDKNILRVGSVKNKKELRVIILNHSKLQEIFSVKYGKKEYTISDIYAGR